MTSVCFEFSGQHFSWKELSPFFVAKGSERFCFTSPVHSDQLVKLSYKNKIKQTKREINYFQFLQKKNVPFLQIPRFFEEVKSEQYLGFVQQKIQSQDGKIAPSLSKYFSEGGKVSRKEVFSLFCFCCRYNILPCDLNKNNILVQKNSEGVKWIMVDGLGCTDWIPLAQYWPWLGRKKIIRKFYRFINSEEKLRILFKNSAEIKQSLMELARSL